MGDKEKIIIGGVDVSKCRFLDVEEDKEDYPEMGGRYTAYECILTSRDCECSNDCLYKQLARKTQVIDEIEEVIKPYQEQIELDALSLPSAIESILERKTQECEELEKTNKLLLVKAQDGISKRAWAYEQCKKRADRYRKALEEIEEVINNILNSCLGRDTVGCRPAHNVCGDLIKILDIISKQRTPQMNKQTLIDDYKQTIERLQKECTEKTDLNIKLMKRINDIEEKLNITNKTISGLKVYIKEIDKLLDKMEGKMNDNNINID